MTGSPEIQLILFRAFDTGIGFDASQVLSVGYVPEGSAGITALHTFFPFLNFSYDYKNPRVLVFRKNADKHVLFEEPVDIITVSKSEISPVPALLRKITSFFGLWGIYRSDDSVYYLYDADLLIGDNNE